MTVSAGRSTFGDSRSDHDLHPFAAAGDDGKCGRPGGGDPHVVLDLGHVLLGRRLLRERPGQHEFGLEYCFGALHDAVERCCHPGDCRMLHPALDACDTLTSVALVPDSIELFGCSSELDNEVTGQVLRVGFTAFFAPEVHKSCLVTAHDNPGV